VRGDTYSGVRGWGDRLLALVTWRLIFWGAHGMDAMEPWMVATPCHASSIFDCHMALCTLVLELWGNIQSGLHICKLKKKKKY
jgi:hypothetical protein